MKNVELEMQALLGPNLAPKALIYVTGSHAVGLNTPESDTDLTAIYWDRDDDRRVFRAHPDVKHSGDNDLKIYSLRNYSTLLVKGNPNVCEMVHLKNETLGETDGMRFWTRERWVVRNFLQEIAPHLATRHLAAAYLGHLSTLKAEVERGKPLTAKRVSHAYRLACSLISLLRTGEVPDFRKMDFERQGAMWIKTGAVTLEEGLVMTGQATGIAEGLYAEHTLPDASRLREIINAFFVELA